MTKNNKYNQLREEIIKAVPDIMEWRCERCNKKHSEYHNGCVICSTDEHFKSKVIKKNRDITLEDCLIAIDKHFNGDGLIDKDDWGCDVGTYWVADLLKLWILGRSLENQDEQTVEFLLDLLRGK